MEGQKRKREKREEIRATSSITCSINLSDILKINEDGSAVITMPKAPDGCYIDHREILEQLRKAGILKGNETYKF
jgi:histidinol-phosphate/aromatic aminotransferase/cobyric acid decarboxylase-like protein